MKKEFEVHYKGFVIIEAESIREANEIMEKKHPDLETTIFYDCQKKESHDVIGHCEASGLSIFEGDEFYSDKGTMWLKEFYD